MTRSATLRTRMIPRISMIRRAMTRGMGIVALGVLACALGACQTVTTTGAPGKAASSASLQHMLDSGELRVGLSGSQPPLNMRDRRGELIGLEVDIVKALASAMGLEPKFLTMPFAELLPTLEKGELDMVISGMTITPERNARVAFAGPYFISGKSVLTKSKTIANVESPARLNDPSRTYAALAGSTSEEFVKIVIPKAKLITTPDYDTAVQMVIADEVDALIADYQICVLSAWRHSDEGLSALMTPFTIEPLGIALPADAPLLLNLVENYLNTLENTGLLTQFKAKWLSAGDWVDELP
jgi:polar amino acid transport system substrate-binding protein